MWKDVTVLSVDVGRGNYKAYARKLGVENGREFCCPARWSEDRLKDISRLQGKQSEDDYCCSVDGNRFLMGKLAINEGNFDNSNYERNKIGKSLRNIIYTMTYLLTSENEDDIICVTSLPVLEYTKINVVRLITLLLLPANVSINNEPVRRIQFSKTYVVPEGSGIYYDAALNYMGDTKDESLLEGNVYVMDIGRRTTNILHFYNGDYVGVDSTSLDTGTLLIERAISDDCRYASEDDLKLFVQTNMNRAAGYWLSARFDRRDKLLLGGGGTKLAEKQFEALYPYAKRNLNPVMACVVGMTNFGANKYYEENS